MQVMVGGWICTIRQIMHPPQVHLEIGTLIAPVIKQIITLEMALIIVTQATVRTMGQEVLLHLQAEMKQK
jgi:hypothetical protein